MSTFFLNYRIFLLNFHLNHTWLYSMNAIAFAISFFVFRIVLNCVMVIYLLKIILVSKILEMPPDKMILGMILLCMFGALFTINIIWFKGIMAHAKRNMQKD
jgi:hypothetical protein